MSFEEMMEEYDEKVYGVTKEDKKLWKEAERIEAEEKCPVCGKHSLIHTIPNKLEFLCSQCGVTSEINSKKKKNS